MDKPTEEQIREFWEWCGFEYVFGIGAKGYWLNPQGKDCGDRLPLIDLNNLFKYAVPRIKGEFWITFQHPCEEQPELWCATIQRTEDIDDVEGVDKDPALALFWALWQVKKGGEK